MIERSISEVHEDLVGILHFLGMWPKDDDTPPQYMLEHAKRLYDVVYPIFLSKIYYRLEGIAAESCFADIPGEELPNYMDMYGNYDDCFYGGEHQGAVLFARQLLIDLGFTQYENK